MKRLFKSTLAALIAMTFCCQSVYGVEREVFNIYVATDGSDAAEGTSTSPVASLEKALDMAAGIAQSVPAPEIHICMKGGTYYLGKTAVITNDLAGNANAGLYIEALEGEHPVLSGGIAVTGWETAAAVDGLPEVASGSVLVADVEPTRLQYRQMWVNNNRAKLASNFDDMKLSRIISKDADGNGLIVPAIPYNFKHPEKVEFTIIQDWAMNILRVKSIETDGFRSSLKFMDPESEIEFKRPWPILRADTDSYSNHFFKLSNAIELLNRPREWYNDAEAGKLYYWPAYGETAENIEVVVPVLETIVSVEGTLDKPVQNVTFRGITFSHATWMRPAEFGHIPLQAGQFLYDAYSKDTPTANNVAWVGRPAAGVSVSNASGITFEDCRFEHMGSTGLDFADGVKHAVVKGSVFNDIGGNGVLAGFFGDEDFEVHQAWNPEDERVVCDDLLIDNNYVCHPAVDDWGCLAIAVGFASNVTISNNEIFDTPYSAINMGWGWVKDQSIMHDNHIIGNYIHSFSNQMRDSGAIYTLSAQPNSSIEQNRVEDVGDPKFNPVMWDMKHSQFDLYTDEGTDYYTVKNNWLERGEISKNQNGSHNTWSVNGPGASSKIKEAAGLKDEYKNLPATVVHPRHTPADSIAELLSQPDIIDYVSPSDGFKMGTAKVIDLNNDGMLDIVYSGGESNQVQHGGVRINMGDYNFAATQGLKRLWMGNFDAGDIDGDGNTDLIQSGWDFWTSYNAILTNDGHGNLTETVLKSSDSAPACAITDVNNDGLVDLIFIGNGTNQAFHIQCPDRTFDEPKALLKLPGGFSDPNMVYGDFNNDGSVDLVLLSNKNGGVYTQIFWNDGNGNFTEGDAGFDQKGTRGAMAVADVNGDGLLDIAIGGTIPGEDWDTPASAGGKTTTLYLNNGDGSFTKHQEFSEYMFDNVTTPLKFIDWNNDGYSDLVITGWNISNGNISQTDVYLNDGNGNFVLSEVDLPGASESSIEFGDFSRSGRNDILIHGNLNGAYGYQGFTNDRRIAVLCRNSEGRVNTRPNSPSNLNAEVTDNSVKLSWDAATDAETPSKSLTYNFYIKDLTTGKYVTSPNANVETGVRTVNMPGNAWHNLTWTVRDLPKGSYVWSVQAIDASNDGSVFAAEQRFEVETSGVEKTLADDVSDINVEVNGNVVTITGMPNQQIVVYSIDGKRIESTCLVEGRSEISLPRGFYLIQNVKIVV